MKSKNMFKKIMGEMVAKAKNKKEPFFARTRKHLKKRLKPLRKKSGSFASVLQKHIGLPYVSLRKKHFSSFASLLFILALSFAGLISPIPFAPKEAHATITARSATTATTNNGTTLAITLPSDIEVGDLILVGIGHRAGSNGTITAPAGWTAVADQLNSTTVLGARNFYKVAVGGDAGSSVTFNSGSGSNTKISAIAVAYGGVDPNDLIHGNSGQVNASSVNIVAPAVTAADPAVRIAFGSTAHGTTINATTDWTQSGHVSTGGGGAATRNTSAQQRLFSTTPNPPAVTMVASNAAVNIGVQIVLKEAPAVTTLGTGTDPATTTVAPESGIRDAGTFTLQTDGGTDSVTALTVILAGSGTPYDGLSEARVTSNDGATTYFSAISSPSSNTLNFSGGTPIPVSTTLTSFKIRVTPKTHSAMPAVPGASYALSPRVSVFTSTNAQAGSDTNANTLTIDNTSPANVTSATVTAGNAQNSLAWTNPADSDFTTGGTVVVLRRAGSAITQVPVEGTTYTVGNVIGGVDTVACVVTGSAPATSCTDSSLSNGTAYHYKIFTRDSRGNYSQTGVVPTGSPATPVAPTTTLGDGTDGANSTIGPGAVATEIDRFSLVTSSGTDTVTGMTVTLAGDVNAYQNIATVEVTDTAEGSGAWDALNATGATKSWWDISVNPSNGDVYAVVSGTGGDIYKQTAGTGTWDALNATGAAKSWQGVSVNSSNGDVYATVNGGDIYKQTAGTGTWDALNATGATKSWRGVSVNSSNGDVYAVVQNGDIYKQTAGTGSWVAQNATGATKIWYRVSVNPSNGDVYAVVYTGDIYKQTAGTGTWDALNATGSAKGWTGISVNSSNGDVYATANAGDIYKQTAGTGTWNALNATGANKDWLGISVNSSNGDVYAVDQSSDIYKQEVGPTTYCSATPSSNTVNLTSCGIPVTTTLTEYKVMITPKSHADMPAVPGASYNITATVTSITATNSTAGTDTDSATITVDNLSPGNVTGATATAGNALVNLAWTNPADSDLSRIMVLASTTAVTFTPVEGTTYATSTLAGDSRVACYGLQTSCSDTSLANGTAYYYKIYALDSRGNWSATGVETTPSSVTPNAVTTTLGDGTDPANATIGPGAPATEIDRFSLVTNTGTDTVTGLTVTLAGDANAYTNIATVAVTDTGVGSGAWNALNATGAGKQWTSVSVNPSNGDVYAVVNNGDIYKQIAGTGTWDALNATGATKTWRGVFVNPSNGDVYATVYLGDIYKQTAGAGTWNALNATGGAKGWNGVSVNPSNGDVYAAVLNGDIYKQTAGTGTWDALNATGAVKNWRGVSVNPSNGDVYATVQNGDIYKQTAGTGTWDALNATGAVKNWRGVSVNPSNGDVYAVVESGDIYKQTAGAGTWNALNATGGAKGWNGVSVNPSNGDVYAGVVFDNDIYKQTGTATTYCSATPSANAVELTTCGIAVTTMPTEYVVKITPKTHANMPAVPGASYSTTATVTAITATNSTSGTDTDSATITVDNLSPGNVTGATATGGDTVAYLAWTNPVDSDLSRIMVLASTTAITFTPVEGTTYATSTLSGASRVACYGLQVSCSDTSLANGTAYYYKIFALDSRGNWSDTGVIPTGSPVTPEVSGTTTLGDGTDGSNSTIGPGAVATEIGRFSLVTNTGTDTVTGVTVTLAGDANAYANIATVGIYNTADALACSLSASSNVVAISTCAISVTTSLTEYVIKITPKSHANMPVVPGASYDITATVTAITAVTNTTDGADTDSATITVDNLSPAEVTGATATAGNTQATLAWTNPADADFQEVIILRRISAEVGADRPIEGGVYVVTNGIGNSDVVYVGSGTSFNHTGLINGSVYHYKIFAKDSRGNYSENGIVPTGSPVTPSAAAVTTLGDGTDGANSTIGPGASATEIGRFSLVTNTGTDTVTGVTVTLAGDVNAYTNIATVAVTDTGVGSGAWNALNATGATKLWAGISVNPSNGDVYAVVNNGDIYKQTAGTGTWDALNATGATKTWQGVSVNPSNGDVYAVVNGGDIYKQTAGTGTWNALNATGATKNWRGIFVNPSNGDVYASVSFGDIYKQTAGTGTWNALNATGATKQWRGISVNPSNGDVYATVSGGDIYKQTAGTGTWDALNATGAIKNWTRISVNSSNGDVYATVTDGDIYKQTAGTGTWDALNATGATKFWTSISVNPSNGDVYAAVSSGDIYKQTGTATTKCSANPSANAVALSTCGIAVTTMPTEYVVRITPKSHANMPVVPGASYNTTATVTSITATNSTAGTDTDSATITVDNLSPEAVRGGVDWTSRNAAVDNQWSSVVYGNGIFVAVSTTGTGNRVMTSPNGIDWTIRDSAADNSWQGVTYGNGLFVAVASSGTGNRVMTSPNGIDWTIRDSAADNSWQGVTYGNGLFVAVATSGTGNRVMTSPNGIDWTIRTSAADNNWQTVAYGNGLFVAISWTAGIGNKIMTSPNGIDWTPRTAAADNGWYRVAYGNGLFVAVAWSGTGNRVMTSPNGIDWTTRDSAADNNWYGLTYGNGLFVATATNGRIMTSPDGLAWTSRTPPAEKDWRAVTYGNGLFVAVAFSGTGNKVMTSHGGTATAGNTIVDLAWTNPSDSDFTTGGTVVLLRRASSAITQVPVEGTTYSVGNVIGGVDTVACVVTGSPPVTSCQDTSLTNGTAYHYKIFTQDSRGNYDLGTVPTGSPVTPVTSGTTLGDGRDPTNSTIGPGAPATEIDRFSLVTNIGSDTVTGMTVTLAGDANAYTNIATVAVTDTGVGAGNWDALNATGAVKDWINISVNQSNGDVYAVVSGTGDIYKQTAGTGTWDALNATGAAKSWRGISVNSSNGDVYATVASGDIYKQTAGTGTWDALNATGATKNWRSVSVNPSNSDVYAVVANGDIYKQTAGTGTWDALNATGAIKGWQGVSVNPSNGDVYAAVLTGDIYKQTAGTGTWDILYATGAIRSWTGVSVNPSNGDVYATVDNGDIYKQTAGTGTWNALNATGATKRWWGVSVNPSNGDVYSAVWTGDIYKQTGTATTYCSTTPSSNTVNLTSCGIPVTTTPTEYVVKITPKTHANMPAVPGASYNTTATVTSITATNSTSGTDSDSATITVDNLSPGNVTVATATGGDTLVNLAWTNPADSDLSRIMVLASTTAVTFTPVEGSTYSTSTLSGASRVACYGLQTSCTDAPLSEGTSYHYKIFALDSRGNWSETGVVPTGSPVTPGDQQITVGNITNVSGNSEGRTFSHNNNGDYLLVGVAMGYMDNGGTPTVTYAGQNMTKLDEVAYGSAHGVSMWGMVNPPSGANNVVATWTGSALNVLGAISFSGVDQSDPVGTVVTGSGNSSNPTLSVSSEVGQMVVDIFTARRSLADITATVGSGQVERVNQNSGSGALRNLGLMSTESGGGNVVMDWTLSGAEPWKGVAVALKPVSDLGTPSFTLTHYIWRDDDGSESGATNLKSEDMAVGTSDRINIGDRIRLRMLASNGGTGSGSGTSFRLEYASSSCSQWAQVPTSSTVQNEHWRMSASSYALDGSATTDYAGLTNPDGKTFTAGYFMHTNSQTPSQLVSGTQFTEHEFSIRSTSVAEAGLTYCFRLTDAGSTTNFTYNVQPQIVLASLLGPHRGGPPFEVSGVGTLRTGGGASGGSGGEAPPTILTSARYIRWVIVKKRSNVSDLCTAGTGSCIQASEFNLRNGGILVPWPQGTVATNPGGEPQAGEGADKLIDNNLSTKALDYNFAVGDAQDGSSTFQIDVGAGNLVTFDGYRWVTANDYDMRDPISWNLYGSNDGSSWALIDTRSDQTITTNRQTYTSLYAITNGVPVGGGGSGGGGGDVGGAFNSWFADTNILLVQIREALQALSLLILK